MSKKTLLLADDSVTIQKVVNLTFADEGIEVITVGDGDTAMQKIYEISPDVVLADVHMPGLSGYQICEIVRENPATYKLPVVLLVGSFEPFDESEAARVGANAYLTKPFQSIRQLVNQVTDLMQGSADESAVAETAPSTIEEVDQPPPKVRDTTDIDSLYHQSFTGPGTPEVEHLAPASVAAPHEDSSTSYNQPAFQENAVDSAAGASRYVDAGMDDEMIETSYVGGPDAAASAPAYEQVQHDYEAQAPATEPYVPQAAEPEHTSEPEYSSESQTSEYSVTTEEYPAVHEYSGEAQGASDNTGYEEGLETGWAPEEKPVSTGAFETFAEDRAEAGDETPTLETSQTDFDQFSQTEQIPASVTQSAFNLDDLEILDLPPIDNGKTQEFTTTPRPADEGGGKEIVTLSPELMDILVQRVVDKLSKDK